MKRNDKSSKTSYKPVKICTADVPWMKESLKSLIMKRQKAFCAYGPDSAQFKYFRNLVNRQRKICRGKYYESKIQHLKGENSKRWCDETKRLCGLKTSHIDLASQINIEGFSELPYHQWRSPRTTRGVKTTSSSWTGSSRVRLAWDLKGNRTARAKSTGSPQSRKGLQTGMNTQLAAERIQRPGGLSHHGNPVN